MKEEAAVSSFLGCHAIKENYTNETISRNGMLRQNPMELADKILSVRSLGPNSMKMKPLISRAVIA